ncbi:MAG: DUF2147 domain-containing protein [Hyphomicrobiales bacterium]|nr:DUF2147 domain-containing protein [Hyphomicrobiales bacterium]MBV8823804.1 DUF2147 domain-containing protein [Hyphomicrobiales bacterium]MBV9428480.1 DUF2147 domain-containing protein [Bradyrhizobiaceae bacterium]
MIDEQRFIRRGEARQFRAGGTRRLLVGTMIAAALAISFAGSARADEPYGTWLRPSTGTQVNFYNCGGKLCGKIVAVKDQSRKGEIGTVIMNGAAKTSDNEWKGDLLNTEDGKTYSGVVTLEGPNALNLKGCALAFICKGETWQRVK